MPDPSDSASPGQRTVDRAKADLRRGLPVVLHGADGAMLALAAEQATDAALARLADAGGAGAAALALTAERASVLHINPTGHRVILVPLTPDMDAAALRGLADPSLDLDHPMRGPFRRLRDAPPAAAEAAVRLCKLAGLLPAAIVAPLAGIGGDAVADWAGRHDLLAVPAAAVERYETAAAVSLVPVSTARVPLAGAEATRITAFRPADGGLEHLAIVVGEPAPTRSQGAAPVLTRLHSECFTGDLLGSLRCDCGEQLRGAIREIARAGAGVLLYLAQEGRGIGLINKLRAYRLQDQGFDTIEANERLGFAADERIFLPAAEMLRQLGFLRVRLMTNNPDKVRGLERWGITVVERVPHAFPANNHNEVYLATKKKRSGHYL